MVKNLLLVVVVVAPRPQRPITRLDCRRNSSLVYALERWRTRKSKEKEADSRGSEERKARRAMKRKKDPEAKPEEEEGDE